MGSASELQGALALIPMRGGGQSVESHETVMQRATSGLLRGEALKMKETGQVLKKPGSKDDNWAEKIERAKQAREAGRVAREGRPPVLRPVPISSIDADR